MANATSESIGVARVYVIIKTIGGTMPSILIADDHALIREGLTRLLQTDKDIQIVGEADNGYTAVEQARILNPDIVLLDLYMPQLDGISATRLIKANTPNTCVILLTVSQLEEDITEAVYSGASGYICKDTDSATFIQQIKKAYAGDGAFDANMVKKLMSGIRHERHVPIDARDRMALSAREKEVLGLIADGLTNKEISSALTISINTTRTYIRSLMQKLHSTNRTQLATVSLREGITNDKDIRSQKFLRTPMQAASV